MNQSETKDDGKARREQMQGWKAILELTPTRAWSDTLQVTRNLIDPLRGFWRRHSAIRGNGSHPGCSDV